ncbi:Lrp/AsnC family transcriptional regulator [Maritalea porphyrae]|uniref:Lrp/AsnC family transcriptional regulator n=1 Tax=Maritalea porphyrae TaxID=880732 RepID=UPI0022AEF3EF|nr:Lrp/AsnC family transcriptional regulator [Maritalea porphyrae]MCZ4272096.1 Lrp/AsnC family transcriptional regulator [Maritalea porphyrae]
MKLDALDRKIVAILQQEGRIRTIDLAERIGLSPTPCARRIVRLEEEGVITGYTATVDQDKMGLPISIFVSVELENQGAEALQRFEKEVVSFEEVMECFIMTGSQDFLMRVVAADLASYEKFLQEKLTRVPGIRMIRSRFALRRIVKRNRLPDPR